MCDRCGDVELASSVLDEVRDVAYWRDLTEVERQFGDIPRMASDLTNAEQEAARRTAPAVRQMLDQLVAEAAELIRDGDLSGIAKLTASYEGPIAKALKASASAAVETGKRQVMDAYRKQRGDKFASFPPRKRPKRKTKDYLNAKAEVLARKVTEDVSVAVRTVAVQQAAKESLDIAQLTAIAEAAANSAVMQAATSVTREGVGVGRWVAIEDASDEVEQMVYTAILDSNVCDSCAEKDNETVTDPDAAPNPDCVGAQYGNECRCAVIVIFKS